VILAILISVLIGALDVRLTQARLWDTSETEEEEEEEERAEETPKGDVSHLHHSRSMYEILTTLCTKSLSLLTRVRVARRA
jgi:uncharacterized membrane-anchored protein YhcB (DUF1043 family)